MKSAPEEDPEAVWLRDTYRPDEPNLTARAVLVGVLIGAVMCLSNIYVFFKTGWSLGVTLTACILAFAVFSALRATGVVRKPLTVLENNALTTVASGAGYMTAGGNAAAFGALLMVTTVRPDQIGMVAWFGVIAAMGVFAAIPIKRQLINKEALPFPTGTATAETIKTIHDAAAGKGKAAARALMYSALFGAALAWVRDAWKLIPGTLAPGLNLMGASLAKWTIAIKTEVVLLGAGALMSFRTGWSLLLGGLLTYGVLGPSLLDRGLIPEASYKSVVGWTLWPGAALLVGAGLTSFALDWKSLARAFRGLGGMFGKKPVEEGIDAVECPAWWFPAGFLVLTPLIVILMSMLFDIPVWAALIAVPLAVLMGFVAARVTGETDVTPTKALGPVTQMMYGVITPGNLSGNIMSANVTGGIGLHAADLLTTLKTGWLLGAKPRHQLYAQLFGVLAGAAILVPAFNLVIPDPSVLGGDDWPAPSCVVWAGVSKAFSGGIDSLHHSTKIAILIGLVLGIAMAFVEKFAPKHVKPYIPSPYGVGIAMVVPCSNSIMMFLGASFAEIIRRKAPSYEGYVVPVASGLIAGESLMGIAVGMMTAAGISLAL